MWDKVFTSIGRLVVRWLELLGQNPPLSRDHGLYAWRYLHEQERRRPHRAPGHPGVALSGSF